MIAIISNIAECFVKILCDKSRIQICMYTKIALNKMYIYKKMTV